jgi:4a-hydroxytetrahydrobiopterin dehydratase
MHLEVLDMEELTEQKCEACRVGAPPVSPEEMKQLQPQVPQWQMIEEDGIPKLDRSFRFKNFKDAIAFTNEVAEAAETEGHHPRITTEWGKVAVTWWTHKIRNLHKNDFIMAAKTDRLYQKYSQN